MPREKRVRPVWLRALVYGAAAAAVILATLAFVSAIRGDGKFMKAFSGIAIKLGFLLDDGGSPDDQVGGFLDGGEENDVTESETDTEGKDTNEEESKSGEEKESAVTVDLSRAEMGDGYIYNYSVESVDVEGLLASGFGGARFSFTEQPMVMIIHTYTSHGYADLDMSDPRHMLTKSVAAVGERLSSELNRCGIATVHITVIHDGKDNEDPYEATRETIETMLSVYPTVECVIDLGRLDVKDENGRDLRPISSHGDAQIRFTVSTAGAAWRDDMALALSLRRELNRNGGRRCMPVTLSDSAYNAGRSLYYIKTDIGGKGNSAAEALLAADALADALERVLKK